MTRVINYIRNYGFRNFFLRSLEKLGDLKGISYKKWLKKNRVTKEELENQRTNQLKTNPLFSVIVPLYKTPVSFLDELIHSIEAQTYNNWEICFSDGSGDNSPLQEKLEKLVRENKKIKVISHKEPKKISQNTNSALRISSGDFVVFVDHDDLLAPNALYECAKAIEENSLLILFITDEDKVDVSGEKFFSSTF
jgi:glycosyltransferase involved in cell wall biosynthesis